MLCNAVYLGLAAFTFFAAIDRGDVRPESFSHFTHRSNINSIFFFSTA